MMGGSGSGVLSPRRIRLPRKFRPGWLRQIDQRTRVAQQLNERMAGIADDLGGLEALSTIQRALLERFVHVDALASQAETQVRSGQPIDLARYLALTDRVWRLGTTLGMHRAPKPRASLFSPADLARLKAAQAARHAGNSSTPQTLPAVTLSPTSVAAPHRTP